MSPQGPAPARTVLIYRNGDRFFPGRRFLVTPRRFPTFEAFLDEVTKALHTPLAVRNLYTPRYGHGVTGLGDLRDGGQYVAAGSERLRKLDYLNQGRKEPRGTRKSLQSRAADPWKSNTFVQQQQLSRLPCTIHVFRNGDLLSPPFPLVLPKRIPLEWDTLLATLTEKVELGSGAVNKLCRLDGTPVCGGEELENGHHYVAVGKEEYKPLPYRELLVPQECRTLRNHPKTRHKKSQGRLGSRRVQATGAAEKGKIPPASPQLRIPARESPLEEEEPIFHVKPVRAGQNRRSSRSVQPGPGEGKSLSKPRDPRREMRGAREEGEHTRLDVDQV
ncbi:doublecortin domain-containing protein 2B isoform X2 [Pipra filicauda]|uniref:Doublecortin domain-containing protein 2B isoform X1 n=1 Tax=Pipra filicauda TaxID=649802 RepID=A0A6J2H8N9_9PASS|nr:doublecortin domain-containing protein 2B isoform X1 [Pipra filicauda]XP_027584144.1 doublecortin domain-containing protein 2B isoform X2 [Pipra filicauda]